MRQCARSMPLRTRCARSGLKGSQRYAVLLNITSLTYQVHVLLDLDLGVLEALNEVLVVRLWRRQELHATLATSSNLKVTVTVGHVFSVWEHVWEHVQFGLSEVLRISTPFLLHFLAHVLTAAITLSQRSAMCCTPAPP